jgi:hypothetical protein
MSAIAAVARSLMKYRAIQAEAGSSTAAFAEAHDVLVLRADIGGVAGMRPDGELVEVGWDDREAKPIASRRWRALVLLSGRRFYPELEALLPQRGAGDRGCDACGGTGTAFGGAFPGVLCACGGLGWIPSDWAE